MDILELYIVFRPELVKVLVFLFACCFPMPPVQRQAVLIVLLLVGVTNALIRCFQIANSAKACMAEYSLQLL